MTAKEAAKMIGCSLGHVRLLVRQGILKAEKKEGQFGEYYDIDEQAVVEYRDTFQKTGFPRGGKRKLEYDGLD